MLNDGGNNRDDEKDNTRSMPASRQTSMGQYQMVDTGDIAVFTRGITTRSSPGLGGASQPHNLTLCLHVLLFLLIG